MHNRLLLVGPNLKVLGGVARYYVNILPHLTVNYSYFGTGMGMGLFLNIDFLIKFFFRLSAHSHVLLSPSMEFKCIIRDFLYALISSFRNRPYALNFMGWDDSCFQSLIKSKYFSFVFRRFLNNSLFIAVPGSSFKANLVAFLGNQYSNKIHVLYPPYEDSQDMYDFNRSFHYPYKVLLLARLEKEKGVFDFLRLSKMVDSKHFSFTLAGTGSQELALQDKIIKDKYPVKMIGRIEGEEKYALYKKHHIFLYPSKHIEGFPLVLAEALRAGLVIVSSKAGCIGDVIGHDNGEMVENLDTLETIVAALEQLKSRNLADISAFNKHFSSSSFSPKNIALSLENFLLEIPKGEES